MAAADDRPATEAPELALARRMHALGFLADGVAHDLANPLGAILAFASLLAADERIPADLRTDARLLREEADRTYRLVSTLLEVARSRPATTGPATTRALPVEPIVRGILDLAAYPLTSVEVTIDLPDDLPDVETDPSTLRGWLAEAVVDAVERLGAPAARGRLRIEASEAEAGAVGEVDGDDDGATGRRVRLAIVDQRPDGQSHRAELALPVHVPDQPAPAGGVRATGDDAEASASTRQRARRPVVLVCDDEASVRALLARVLDRAGCVSREAASGEEALILLEIEAVDAVVSDHRLPAMTGIELYERLVAKGPNLAARFVLLSGDPEDPDVAAFTRRTGVSVLAKPFDVGEIEAAIRRLVEGPSYRG